MRMGLRGGEEKPLLGISSEKEDAVRLLTSAAWTGYFSVMLGTARRCGVVNKSRDHCNN